ncbi:MAG: SH3 domain-containing protein [Butyrivibrio sp.]|nr:SH3 domain-containing protein [Butyrivibrio sp.]
MKRFFMTATVFVTSVAMISCTTPHSSKEEGSTESVVENEDKLGIFREDIDLSNVKNTGELVTPGENNSESDVANTDNDNNDDKSANIDNNSENNSDNTEAKEEKKEIVVNDVSKKVITTKACNVRNLPTTDDSEIIGKIEKDTVVDVTGLSETNWYRFEYEGKTGYANSIFFIDKDEYDKQQAELKRQQEEKEKAALEAQKKAEEEKRLAEEKAAQEAQQANNSSSFAAQVVALCNEQRAAAGLEPLVEDAALDSRAQIRAGEIITSFSHTRPDGSSCFTVIGDCSWTTCGENIAAGYQTPQDVVNGWMNSEGHRANIMNPSFRKIGIGYCTGGSYGTNWVQLFTD